MQETGYSLVSTKLMLQNIATIYGFLNFSKDNPLYTEVVDQYKEDNPVFEEPMTKGLSV